MPELISATVITWPASQSIIILHTRPPQFGPSHTQISLDHASIGSVPPELPNQVLSEPEHKQPKTGFALIEAHQSSVDWFRCHSEPGTHILAYPSHLGCHTEVHKKVMDGMPELI